MLVAVQVNSRVVRGWPHNDVVRYLRGCSPPVTLTVDRVDSDKHSHYEVVDQVMSAPLRQPPVTRGQNQASDGDSGMGRSELSASSHLLSSRPSDACGPGRNWGAGALGRPLSPRSKNGFDRNCDVRMSLRTESEMSKDNRRSRIRKPSLEPILDRDRAEVKHLVSARNLHRGMWCQGMLLLTCPCTCALNQDITLHRSLGTRLGITLGFDQNKKETPLYVMDVSGGQWVSSVGVFMQVLCAPCSSWRAG